MRSQPLTVAGWAITVGCCGGAHMSGFFPGGGALARRYFPPTCWVCSCAGFRKQVLSRGNRARRGSGLSGIWWVFIRSQGGSPVCLVLAFGSPCTGSLPGDVTVPCLLVAGGLCSFVMIPRPHTHSPTHTGVLRILSM